MLQRHEVLRAGNQKLSITMRVRRQVEAAPFSKNHSNKKYRVWHHSKFEIGSPDRCQEPYMRDSICVLGSVWSAVGGAVVEFNAPAGLTARFLCFWTHTISGTQGATNTECCPTGA
jgi:hypothetical protein